MMGWVMLVLCAVSIAGLVGIYALLVNNMAKGLERQRQNRLELEARLRRKGVIE